MLSKAQLQKSIETLPDSFSIDELIEKLLLIQKIEEGVAESKSGKTISHEDVLSIIQKWSA
jgi:predicted transcriptional regulator